MRAWPLILMLVVVAAGLALSGADFPARTESSVGAAETTAVGVDVDSSGNTATSLGPINVCREVSVNDTFTIDVYIQDVTNLAFVNTFLSYNGSVVNVVDNQVVGMFMGSGEYLVHQSDSNFPDSDGSFFLGALDYGGSHSGSGVFARVTLKAVGAGASQLNLLETTLADGGLVEIPFSGPFNGAIRVNQPCSSTDSDGDGVADIVDNCPAWPNADQSLPPWPVPAGDPDCDGFTTALESYVGTDPNVACGADAWPPDINSDGDANNLDFLPILLSWLKSTGEPGFNQRVDLNQDEAVNNLDFLPILNLWLKSCT